MLHGLLVPGVAAVGAGVAARLVSSLPGGWTGLLAGGLVGVIVYVCIAGWWGRRLLGQFKGMLERGPSDPSEGLTLAGREPDGPASPTAGCGGVMKVLVVTHDSTLSGAPRVALLVARLMVEAGHDVRVLSRTPGPCPRSSRGWHRRGSRWHTGGAAGFGGAHRASWRSLSTPTLATLTLLVQRPDLVYVNSTSAALYARVARWVRVPAIALHVHESGANSDVFLRRAGLRRFDQKILWVACSPSVQHELAESSLTYLRGRSSCSRRCQMTSTCERRPRRFLITPATELRASSSDAAAQQSSAKASTSGKSLQPRSSPRFPTWISGSSG